MKNKMNFRTNRIIQMICLGLFIISTPIIYAQKDTLHIKDIYSNPSNYLVLEKIINVDSTSKQELMNRFENWGGSNFRDYSNVKTSKTDDQITLLYIVEANSKMYVILKAEFKENKVRVSFYDDGNVAVAGSYVSGSYNPGIPARSYKIAEYFENGSLIYKVNGGTFNVNTIRAKNAISYKKLIDNTFNEIEKTLKIKQTNTLKSDW
jgi:hypothetical protein